MFKDVGDKWFNTRSGQSTLHTLPRLPVFIRSNMVRSQKTVDKQPEKPKPFVAGESEVGGNEVAM